VRHALRNKLTQRGGVECRWHRGEKRGVLVKGRKKEERAWANRCKRCRSQNVKERWGENVHLPNNLKRDHRKAKNMEEKKEGGGAITDNTNRPRLVR